MTYLVVGPDIVRIEEEAIAFSKSFNPADVFWIKKQPDKKEITVADVSHFISQTDLAAVSGKKLFIVFEADLLNAQAQNKLLKTIEDADDNTTVLFLARTITPILPTVKSRSVVLYNGLNKISGNQETPNHTINKLIKDNPDAKAIYAAAEKLINSASMNDAIAYMPILTKPDNLTLAFDALNKSVKAAAFPPQKKYALYTALSNIARNIDANCNAANAFDLLLLALF